MMSGDSQTGFPCEAVPEDPAAARLLGIYPQRGGELLMQRVKVAEGEIRPRQLRGLGVLAERYTPGYPLHVTTRQDVELHGLSAADVPAVQRGIVEAGLTTVGSCGDSVRNVTVCAGSGFHAGTWNVLGVAASIRSFMESLPWVRSLPRKFKISLSGCPRSCARPWINDLGLVANEEGTFSAILAGSLGRSPVTGRLLYEALQPGEILPLVSAVLKLFHAEGGRRRRGQARLRHLRERLGDEEFCKRISGLFEREKGELSVPEPSVPRVESEVPLRARLSLPLGDIAPEAAIALSYLVEASGAELRVGLQHDLFLFGGAPLPLGPWLRSMIDRPSLVACPGSTWCARAVADSRAAARRILGALPDDCRLSISVAGCPNNCPHAAVADVGLIGRVKRIGDQRVECFRVLVGGGHGQTPDLAREVHPAVPADKLHETVVELTRELSDAREASQRSADSGETR